MWILTLKFGFNNLGFEIRIHQKIRISALACRRYHITGSMAPVLTSVAMLFQTDILKKDDKFLVKQASKIKFSLRQLQPWRDLQVSLSQVLSRFIKILTWTVWNSTLLCFPQWTNECHFFEKYFHFVLKMPNHKYQVII